MTNYDHNERKQKKKRIDVAALLISPSSHAIVFNICISFLLFALVCCRSLPLLVHVCVSHMNLIWWRMLTKRDFSRCSKEHERWRQKQQHQRRAEREAKEHKVPSKWSEVHDETKSSEDRSNNLGEFFGVFVKIVQFYTRNEKEHTMYLSRIVCVCVCFSPFSQTFHQVNVLATADALRLPSTGSLSLAPSSAFLFAKNNANAHTWCALSPKWWKVSKKCCVFFLASL